MNYTVLRCYLRPSVYITLKLEIYGCSKIYLRVKTRMHDLKLKLNVLAKFLSGFSKKEYYCQKGWSGTKHQHQRPCGG